MTYKIHISDFGCVGGVHFYGTIRRADGKFICELTRPDPAPMPDWYDDEDRASAKWTTVRFPSEWDVVLAAKAWFDIAPEVQAGDKLTVWRDHLCPADREQIRKWRDAGKTEKFPKLKVKGELT